MRVSTTTLAPRFAICYDLSSNQERRRVDKLLKGYGFRVQKSVFECHLTPNQKRQLRQALTQLALCSGNVRMYRVYGGSSIDNFGSVQQPTPDETFSYAI